MPRPHTLVATCLFVFCAAVNVFAQATVAYRLSFPEREHRLMQVEATFTDVPDGPLQLRMSRTSPGRYSLHEFAKHVFDVRVTDPSGRPLTVVRPNAHQWDVTDHAGAIRVTYRLFGDRVDGTYLGIDSTHAHINMPAAIMWARGLERRPLTVRFERPSGTSWRIATQLMPGTDDFTYSAPNLQYLMDSPAELSDFALRTFTVRDEMRTPVFRVAVHHTGTDADVDAFARDIQSIVGEARHVFGEFPPFESNTYTFIADYLPWASGDGMEHRNSTVVTSPSSIRQDRIDLLDTISHEFFHSWNVERIRPKALEPFNFEDANMTGELWLGEGFTSYYGPLIMRRADLYSLRAYAQEIGRVVGTVSNDPGRRVRSAVEMSEFAQFIDRAASVERTSFENTVISYYTWGAAIALGLDLSLRERTNGRVTLDDFMRALWEKYGKPGSTVAGYVATPYTRDDLKTTLAAVAGDGAFANDFFARYIEGREIPDFRRLLSHMGFVLRPAAAGRPYTGVLQIESDENGARIVGSVPFGSPAYEAGLEREDMILSMGGIKVTSSIDVEGALRSRKPGDSLPVIFDRRGTRVSATIKLIEDPRIEVVPAEEAGQSLTEAQRRSRDAWLSSPSRNTF